MPNFDFTLNSYNLSKVGLFDTGLREQNIYLSPKPAKKFNNSATRKDYLLKNNIPYDPNGGFYTEDSESLITWTYVADYSLHRYHTSPIKNFYIHCRINKKGQLEFGSFDRIIGDKGTSSAYIFNSDLENKNQSFPLKIANKKEAETVFAKAKILFVFYLNLILYCNIVYLYEFDIYQLYYKSFWKSYSYKWDIPLVF